MSFKSTADVLSAEGSKAYSCRICGGKIVPALYPIMKTFNSNVPENVLLAGYFRATGYFFLCTSSEVYASINGSTFTDIASIEGDSPFMIEDIADGKPRAVIIKGANAVYSSNRKNGVYYNYGANLSCGIMHCGRLFGADMNDGFKLCWSGEGGLCDWTEGLHGSGSLTLDSARGSILDIVRFGEKLVAVREYGLTVLSMFGSPENFSAEITDTDTDKIFKGTAQVVGGELFFYTASGLCAYDGSVIKKLRHRNENYISDPKCSAGFDGKYFLSFTDRTGGDKALMCYDIVDGDSYLINAAADGLCVADKVYIFGPQGGYCLEVRDFYKFLSGEINFGSGRRKTVTQMYIDGETNIEIRNGRIKRRFPSAKGVIRPKLRGESFTVAVFGLTNVNSVTLTAEECDAI